MVLLAGSFASWMLGQVADAGRKRLSVWVLGTDQERALRRVADVAVQRTARELCPEDIEQAAAMAMVINQLFSDPVPPEAPPEDATLLEAIQAQIARQLAPLDDPELTGTGRSSSELLGEPAAMLAEKLAGQLLREIRGRGARGGPLAPLASQLNFDLAYLQGQRLEGMLARLVGGLLLEAAPAVSRTLPRDVVSFTDRQAELSLLRQALPRRTDAGGVVRIGAIDGMAGAGKTAFAVHAAHKLASRFPDGQLFVRLHGHTPGHRPAEPADVLAALLLADGIAPQQVPQDIETREELWRDRMAGRRTLLLFDDASGSDQLLPLLPGTAGTLVLVTSRHRLPVLSDALAVTVDVMDAGEAARLLVKLAGRPGLVAGDDAVGRLAELCGFLPLAISLMAGQLKHHRSWTVAYQAAELEAATDRLAMMTAENLSVAAAFDLSYRTLPPACQRLLRRLGLHPGTDFDAYAAAALDGTDLGITRTTLDELFAYHLIDEPVQGRYRFHDLIRAYARNLAAADPAPDRDQALDRLLGYYLHTARAADRHLARRTPARPPELAQGPPQCAPDLPARKDAVSWMDSERQTLHAAVDYAAAHGRPIHAIAISAAMHGYLCGQGHWIQALTLHRTALESAEHANEPAAEAGALIDLGTIQRLIQEYPAAVAGITRALELYRGLGNRLGEATARNELAILQYLTSDYQAAIASFTAALELFRDSGDRLGEADALDYLGFVKYLAGDYPAATSYLESALEVSRDLSNRAKEASSRHHLGSVLARTGDYPAAMANLEGALELVRSLGNPLGEAHALYGLADVQARSGDHRGAAESRAQALLLYRRLGDRLGEANALNDLGTGQHQAGNYAAAAANLDRALHLYQEIGSQLGEANARTNLAAGQLDTGGYDAATANLTRALQLYRSVGNRFGEAAAITNLGEARHLAGDQQAAVANLTDALELYRNIGNPDGEASVLNSLGQVSLASAKPHDGRAHYEQALAIAATIGSPLEEARALEGIGLCQIQNGQPDDASANLRQALAIYRRLESRNVQRVEAALRDLGR
jgi:tetratricopeptide (TPR) repeat protein